MSNIATGLQYMPEQDPEVLSALKEDIQEHGVQVRVVIDQHGRILDGNNRAAIALELGIPYPTETVHVANDDEAENRAIALNMKRRTMTQKQMRELIADQIKRHPEMSDRAIAKRLGSSHPTVATVRRGGKSFHPEEVDRKEAAARAEQIIALLNKWYEEAWMITYFLMSNGVDQFRILRALRAGQARISQHEPQEVWGSFGQRFYGRLIDIALDDAVLSETGAQSVGPEFLPIDEELSVDLLAVLADPVGEDKEGAFHADRSA